MICGGPGASEKWNGRARPSSSCASGRRLVMTCFRSKLLEGLRDYTTESNLTRHEQTQLSVSKAFGDQDLTIGPILGSGCVAQVHRGTLHGRDVAVKVVHPGRENSWTATCVC